MARTSQALAATNIHKRFEGTAVLKGVSLDADQGDVIALIGASGSGKSTLLRCLNLLEIPDGGEVAVRGEPLRLTTDKRGARVPEDWEHVARVRTRLGMVFQNFNLWTHMTVRENVMEAPLHVQKREKDEVRRRAGEVLEKVGIADKAEQYPAQLSGGQQQRAAIARALAMEPAVMLFDEPTSALDPELVGEVLRVIRQLAAEGRTMILVTHEMKFARDTATQVIFLHNGEVEESGDPSRVLADPVSPRARQFVLGDAAADQDQAGR